MEIKCMHIILHITHVLCFDLYVLKIYNSNHELTCQPLLNQHQQDKLAVESRKK